MSALSMLVFSMSGLPSFFTVHTEMKEPKHYNRAMFASLIAVFTIYTGVAVPVYIFCGSHVSSPALGSAGSYFKIVCYSIALLGLCVTACLICHVCRPLLCAFALIDANTFALVRSKASLPPSCWPQHSLSEKIQLADQHITNREQCIEGSSQEGTKPTHLVLQHLHRGLGSMHHRQRCSRFRSTGGADRRPVRHIHLLHADGSPLVPR